MRVCAPDGRVLVVTWCHRVLAPGEAVLTADEASLLDRICEAYYLPAWCSVEDYRRLFGEPVFEVCVCVCVQGGDAAVQCRGNACVSRALLAVARAVVHAVARCGPGRR